MQQHYYYLDYNLSTEEKTKPGPASQWKEWNYSTTTTGSAPEHIASHKEILTWLVTSFHKT